jgi:hypothetical protein
VSILSGKTHLECLLEGRSSNYEVKKREDAAYNKAIDEAIKVVEYKMGGVFPTTTREIISKLQSLKK